MEIGEHYSYQATKGCGLEALRNSEETSGHLGSGSINSVGRGGGWGGERSTRRFVSFNEAVACTRYVLFSFNVRLKYFDSIRFDFKSMPESMCRSASWSLPFLAAAVHLFYYGDELRLVLQKRIPTKVWPAAFTLFFFVLDYCPFI